MSDVQIDSAPKTKRVRFTPMVRRKTILDAAADIFMERGYSAASVDSVVDKAGGSKATVYALFGNKEGLLTALVAEGAEALVASIDALNADQPLEATLKRFGLQFLRASLDPQRASLYRLVIGESGRFPQLGDAFYQTGPATVTAKLAGFFRILAERGAIRTTEPARLAGYFLGALRGDLHFRVLFDRAARPSDAELLRHVDFVVANFLQGLRLGTPVLRS